MGNAYLQLTYPDLAQALHWIEQCFSVQPVKQYFNEDQSIQGAEIYIGTTLFLLTVGQPQASLAAYVHVDDVVAHIAQSRLLGREIYRGLEPSMTHSQDYQVRDGVGYVWTIGNYAPRHVWLRDVLPSDLPIFYVQQTDPLANHMAAFTPDYSDKAAFDERWARIMANPAVINQTIIFNGRVVGNISSFEFEGERDIGYWIGQEYWGNGIASQALRQFLQIETTRPIGARVAFDNLGSQRVLEKCGFKRIGEAVGFAGARNADTQEFIYQYM